MNVVDLTAVAGSEDGATGGLIFCTVGVEKRWTEGVDAFGTGAVEDG